MGLFKKVKKESSSSTPRQTPSPEALELQFGPEWNTAKEDLQNQIELLFPKVLRPEKKIYADEVAGPKYYSLLLEENPKIPAEISSYFPYFYGEHYEASEHDFKIFQSWCETWIEQSDMPTRMWATFSSADQTFISYISVVVLSSYNKRLLDSGIPEGANPAAGSLENSRTARIEEFEEIFRYDFLENIDDILKLSTLFDGKEVVPPWIVNLPDTLLSRLISGPLVSVFDRNLEVNKGHFNEYWGVDYSLYFVVFISAWLLSKDRTRCKLRSENWITRLSPTVRDAWFLDV